MHTASMCMDMVYACSEEGAVSSQTLPPLKLIAISSGLYMRRAPSSTSMALQIRRAQSGRREREGGGEGERERQRQSLGVHCNARTMRGYTGKLVAWVITCAQGPLLSSRCYPPRPLAAMPFWQSPGGAPFDFDGGDTLYARIDWLLQSCCSAASRAGAEEVPARGGLL